MLAFTDWAIEVLRRAHEAAARFNPEVRLRLRRGAAGLEPTLTDTTAEGERALDVEGVPLVVAEDLAGLVDVEAPHDRLVLRAPGARPHPRS